MQKIWNSIRGWWERNGDDVVHWTLILIVVVWKTLATLLDWFWYFIISKNHALGTWGWFAEEATPVPPSLARCKMFLEGKVHAGLLDQAARHLLEMCERDSRLADCVRQGRWDTYSARVLGFQEF